MTIIKTWDNGANYGDFDRWEITLIRRKRYHLICEGGPRTAFVEKCGENQWCAGKVEIMLKLEEAKKIKEMGADEVYDWAKEALLEAENWH